MAGTSGPYLTRFEDFYKSSDEDDDEEDSYTSSAPVGGEIYGGPMGDFYNSDSEDDERPDDGMINDHRDEDWEPAVRDWVPQSLVDLKLRIKAPPKKGAAENDDIAEQIELRTIDGEERVYSNDYQDVCKYRCKVCCQEVETERLRSHMSTVHQDLLDLDIDVESETRKEYDVKTWHRCGVCLEDVVFTRVRLRYHVINNHGITIQNYNEKYMTMRGMKGNAGRRRSVVNRNTLSPSSLVTVSDVENDSLSQIDVNNISEDQISNDYADIVKVQCKICQKSVEQDNFRFVHLKKHGMDVDDYGRSYGEPVLERMMFHRCHICEQILLFTRSRLSSHLTRHKITTKDYGTKFLTKVKSDKSRLACLTVGEIDKDCMFSNDYEDECSTICQLCNRSLNFGNFGSHLYQSHGMRMKEFVEQFGEPEIHKKSYHECAICHETLLFVRYQLAQHVKTKHGLSINSYNVAHMQLHNVEYSDSSIADKGRKIGTQKAPQWCDGTMYKCPYCFNIYYRYFTFRIHLINSHKMMDSEERSTCVRENEIITDIYQCKICQVNMKRDRMDIEAHLKQSHKTTIKVYAINFENQDSTESSTEAVSRLVKEGVLENPSDKLFKTPRKIKGGKKETPSKKEMTEVPKSVETLVERVPLNGVNITGSMRVESKKTPTKRTVESSSTISPIGNIKQEKTGRVKSKPSRGKRDHSKEPNEEEDYSSDMNKRKRKMPSKYSNEFEVGISGTTNNTSNSSRVDRSPKKQKLISGQHLSLAKSTPELSNFVIPKHSKGSEKLNLTPPLPLNELLPPNIKQEKLSPPSNSQISKSSSDKLNNSFKIISPKIEDPVPLLTLSPRAAKLSHSLVSVRQPDKETVTTVKTEPLEPTVLYKCPLENCEWTCGREGMRQGPAVLHLLRSHKIQPKEMRERGIKFDKIFV